MPTLVHKILGRTEDRELKCKRKEKKIHVCSWNVTFCVLTIMLNLLHMYGRSLTRARLGPLMFYGYAGCSIKKNVVVISSAVMLCVIVPFRSLIKNSRETVQNEKRQFRLPAVA